MKNELIHLLNKSFPKQSETWFPIDFDIAHDPALNMYFLCHHQYSIGR